MTATVPQPIQRGGHRVTSVPRGATTGAVSPATGSIRLAGEHFAAATFYLLAGACGLVWIAPELAVGNYLSPHVAGITHLFTLGWLTTTIFGALYQLLPVALGAPIRWPRIAHASFWTFAPGAGLFACGVADSSTLLRHVGVGLITIGILLAVTNLAATLPRARARDVTWAAVTLALAFLLSTLGLGIVLLHNLHTGFIAAARLHVLATHLHVAIVGWAMIMIVGVSHRLVPMFLLAHGASTKWTKPAIALLAIGVPTLAVGLNTRIAYIGWIGVAALDGGIACFLWQAYSFYRVRVRKNIEIGMRFAATALAFVATAAVLGPILFAEGASSMRLATAYVVVGLLGGVVIYVVGFFYKIVPLLAWTARYRGQMSKPGVPTVAELYSARVARLQLAMIPSGVALLAIAIALASPALSYVATTLFAAGVILFVSQIARVARGGRLGVKT